MPELTWEQKFDAMRALTSEASIRKSYDGSWYVYLQGVERKEGDILSSGGNFRLDIMGAVNYKWAWLTDPRYYIVVNALGNRKAVKWNGFMWKDEYEQQSKSPS